ncbi:MAG: peptidoglycan DD-metalloendopeptidase family protein [Candidatus Omnitrophota bacterium]|nr:peptidoglycan DD-metalloendopeptidase family protein [Candidatus Omnitrophota bacterium]
MNKILVTILLALGLAGCSTAPTLVKPGLPPVQAMPGIYHRVEKGQTLWRISKIYGIDLEELARVNKIADTTAVEVGQQVFIPNRVNPPARDVKYNDNDDFIWPLRGRLCGSFGQTINNILNKGINIQPSASLDILASRSGKIVFIDNDFAGFGKTVIIEHNDGLFTVYGRNARIFVKAGDSVQKGTIIAKAGAAGRERNTYLHFEVRRGAVPQNPLFYLP